MYFKSLVFILCFVFYSASSVAEVNTNGLLIQAMNLLKQGDRQSLKIAKEYLLEGSYAGDSLAQFKLGHLYRELGDLNQAAYWYTQALDSGMYRAHIYLVRYCSGINVSSVRPEALSNLSNRGEGVVADSEFYGPADVQAQGEKVDKEKPQDIHSKVPAPSKKELVLGKEYSQEFHQALKLKSFGYYEKSFKIFKKYADLGDSESQFNLAQHYRMGWGVDANIQRAASYYGKAAVQGHADSQLNFALVLYELNDGDEVDFTGQDVEEKILFWTEEAIKNGNLKAKQFLKLLD